MAVVTAAVNFGPRSVSAILAEVNTWKGLAGATFISPQITAAMAAASAGSTSVSNIIPAGSISKGLAGATAISLQTTAAIAAAMPVPSSISFALSPCKTLICITFHHQYQIKLKIQKKTAIIFPQQIAVESGILRLHLTSRSVKFIYHETTSTGKMPKSCALSRSHSCKFYMPAAKPFYHTISTSMRPRRQFKPFQTPGLPVFAEPAP